MGYTVRNYILWPGSHITIKLNFGTYIELYTSSKQLSFQCRVLMKKAISLGSTLFAMLSWLVTFKVRERFFFCDKTTIVFYPKISP